MEETETALVAGEDEVGVRGMVEVGAGEDVVELEIRMVEVRAGEGEVEIEMVVVGVLEEEMGRKMAEVAMTMSCGEAELKEGLGESAAARADHVVAVAVEGSCPY